MIFEGIGFGLGILVLNLLVDEYFDVYRFIIVVYFLVDDDVIILFYNRYV